MSETGLRMPLLLGKSDGTLTWGGTETAEIPRGFLSAALMGIKLVVVEKSRVGGGGLQLQNLLFNFPLCTFESWQVPGHNRV